MYGTLDFYIPSDTESTTATIAKTTAAKIRTTDHTTTKTLMNGKTLLEQFEYICMEVIFF